MKLFYRPLAGLLVLASANLASSQVTINGNITDSSTGPLLANTVYHVTSSVTVPLGETLTIQAGAVIKFQSVAGTMTVNGTLDANGLSGNPIILTSIADDTAGGDTNGDGTLSLPAPGQFRGIYFNSSSDASTVDWLELRYGGQGGFQAFDLTAADITLTNCTVRDTLVNGIDLSSSSFPTITDCSFIDNAGIPIQNVPLMAVPGFSNNSAAGNGGGNRMRVSVGTLNTNTAIVASNLLNSVLVIASSPSITAGANLTFGPGVIVKADGAGIRFEISDGTLEVDGISGNPMILTSIFDDTAGGDTNGDAGATLGAPGQWRGLNFLDPSDASDLNFCELRYSGQGGFAGIDLNSADITMNRCILRDTASFALHLGANSFPTVTSCSFVNNSNISVEAAQINAVENFVNNVSSGTGGNYIRVSSGTLSASTTLAPNNLLGGALVTTTSLSVPGGTTLTLEAGCVIKHNSAGAQHQINGTLEINGSSGNPVVLTTFADDTIAGDTNQNGASTGAAGSWRGLDFLDDSDSSDLQWCELRFGGQGAFPVIDLNDADISISNCTISDATADGLDLSANSFPTVSGCTITGCDTAVDNIDIDAVDDFSGNSASGNTRNYMRITIGSVSEDLVIVPDNCLEGALVTTASLNLPDAMTLTLQAGVIIKADGAGTRHIINGTLLCNGAGNRVIFTSLADDTAGGDTNGDGNATSGAPGQWRGLDFRDTSDASNLSRTDVRHGGQGGFSVVDLNEADITLSRCILRDSTASGLDLSNNSFPSVRNCTFDDHNNFAVTNTPVAAVPNFGFNSAAGNGIPGTGGDYIQIATGTVNSNVTIEDHACLGGALVTESSITVNSGATLTLGPGVVIKSRNAGTNHTISGSLICDGTLARPVVFTAIRDDSIAGDTNGDGPATLPVPGLFRGIRLDSDTSRLINIEIRYGGQAGFSSLDVNAASDLDGVRVERSAGPGIDLNALGFGTDLTAWACSGVGVLFRGGSFDASHITSVGNATGIEYEPAHSGTLSNSIAWGNTTNYLDLMAGELLFSNGDATLAGANGNLNTDPLFVDEANGNLNLTPASPSLDMGDPLSEVDPDCTDADQGAYPLDQGAPFTYCVAKVNSLGCTPFADFTGYASASSTDDFVLTANDVLNNKAGLFFYGSNGPLAVPFQGGTLCLAPPLRRTGITFSGGLAPPNDCSGTYSFEFNDRIQSGVDDFLIPGASINGQFWSRDPQSSNGTGLTNGIQFVICP